MRLITLATAVALGGFAASPPGLQVLRVSPVDVAPPTTAVTVTFDRPVAGNLDGTIDPRSVFSISPAAAGTVEWRDPITLRFTPSAPLTAGTTYTVTIASTLRAMDGARLDQPYRFGFRVNGPAPVDGTPVGRYSSPQFLRPATEFDILVSSPVELDAVSRSAIVQLHGGCNGPSRIRLTATTQRAVTDRDPARFQSNWEYRADRRLTALRRIVHLKPEQPLPLACAGSLVLPAALDGGSGPIVEWPFATYGPLTLEHVTCTNDPQCPAGYAMLDFSTPVSGAEVMRRVRLDPATPFTVDDTSDEHTHWVLEAALKTRTRYTVRIDGDLRDVLGQRFTGPREVPFQTTGYAAGVEFPTGRMLVERESFRTLAVRHVNVDSLVVTFAPVPESLEARVLATPEWNLADSWGLIQPGATSRAIPVANRADTPMVSAVRLPVYNSARPASPALTMVRIGAQNDTTTRNRRGGGIALVQVTDLGVAAKLGLEEAIVWVTTVHDGLARPGATVTLFGPDGAVRARGTTDSGGLVRLRGLRPDSASTAEDDDTPRSRGFEGYVSVSWNSDRAVVAFDQYSWELSPWRFNVSAAYEAQRLPAAAAVFTERGIYRPGETVFAKAIVRTGPLGALRAPARGDSLRWRFYDREEGSVRDTTVALSAFGTADEKLTIAGDQALGTYRVGVQLKRDGKWTELASAFYRIAEYRPPEFLVGINGDTAGRLAGDTLTATVEARYLFGAPMARAAVSWTMRRSPMWPWELRIPGMDAWEIGDGGWWWEDDESSGPRTETMASGTDTLDLAGRLALRLPLGTPKNGRAARVSLEARVTDINRQLVASTFTQTVHPAAFYIAAKPAGADYFWRAGVAVEIAVLAVRPDGRRVAGVVVHGTIARREWHRVQRRREDLDERVGEWVSDTVAQCDVTTSDVDPEPCRFTPAAGGTYQLSFKARDTAGRVVSTSFYRWATGRGWVPWGDESQFKMDVIPDRTRYDVGDTATVLFAAPFTDAEALVTVEREGIIEHRRLRITAGATSLKFAITEAHVPNAFVSIVIQRGRSAPPGGITDAGRPALRVGYAELKVTPAVKRLRVEVQARATEYRPGDSARIHIAVRDSRGTGRRAEVTLWAVDEGVLSLTGYRTPDPVELLYRARGVGMRLASDLISVAPQVMDSGLSIKGDRAPGGGGGLESGDILRSRFASTAFFLGSVITGENGEADVAAKLPDNLTTFRVMAVAVTAGDRFGSGESPMLVTRPLLARPALPRFLRQGDRFLAGVVVNQRSGAASAVRVRSNARGAVLTETSPLKTVMLAASRGSEVRFAYRDTTADTAAFRFDVTNGRDSDAVLTRLPVRPSNTPRAYAVAGIVRVTSTGEIELPADIDPARSKLVFGIGVTPLAIVRGMYRQLAIYPFECTEQIASEMLPLAAFMLAGAEGRRLAPNARAELELGVQVLTRRQRADGGIGLWSAEDWTTPWLTTHAGEALLAARAAGLPVRDTLLLGIAAYLSRALHQPVNVSAPVIHWFELLQVRLAEQVAAADFLSRMGRPDLPAENELLRVAAQMAWEDRLRLAQMLARRGAAPGARALLTPMWSQVRVEGRRATLPDSAVRSFYFWSPRRPAARLLSATLAVDPGHALIGPLVETVSEQGRGDRWNTQDYGAAVAALTDFSTRQRAASSRGYTVAAAGRVLFRSTGDGPQEFTRDLTGILAAAPGGAMRLTLTVAATAAEGAPPLYYHVSVHEVPKTRPVTPDQQGIAVERWYENYETGRPIVTAVEGSLVRVRLRITVPAERNFLALTDPLPAGLEAVDLSLRTTGGLPGPAAATPQPEGEGEESSPSDGDGYRWGWYYGSWDSGWWSPFDHRELRDDRVAWVATYLWPGTYTATYVARATTPGVFVRPPAHAEEMYNPSVQGRSDGGVFSVTRRAR